MTVRQSPELPEIQNAYEWIQQFVERVERCKSGDTVGISTMQIASQPNIPDSPVEEAVDALVNAKSRGVDAYIAIDATYVGRMTRINNRDYPDYLPLISRQDRAERKQNKQASARLLNKLDSYDMLRESGVQQAMRGYTPRLRHNGSHHPLQSMAVKHAKEAHIITRSGKATTWITSANFTDSDLIAPDKNNDGIGMNNLTFRIGDQHAQFTIRSMKDGFGHTSGIHTYSDKNVMTMHDVNNSGEPARLPGIIQEALATVDPKRSTAVTNPLAKHPKKTSHLLYISQYLPDGIMYSALEDISHFAKVFIPTQPPNDHRVKAFPYNLHSARQGRKIAASGMITVPRAAPSHSKVILARYDDDTARIIGSTDNFAVHLQKFARNEELGLRIDLDLRNQVERVYFNNFISLLHRTGELDLSAKEALTKT